MIIIFLVKKTVLIPVEGLIVESENVYIIIIIVLKISASTAFVELPPEITRVLQMEEGAHLLGSPVYGSAEFFENSVAKKVEKILEMQAYLEDLDDPQVEELHLLRSCLSQCKLNYLLQTLPPGSALEACKRFDMGLRHSLESITRSSLDNAVWQQAALPIRLGGLGLREAVASAPAAFLGSRNTTRESTSYLVGSGLSTSLDITGDEEEGILRAKLSVELPGINLNAASQRVLQSTMDAKALSKCKESASIRDRARLNTLGTHSAGA